MVSPLPLKVAAGVAALVTGILGGAYVAGSTAAGAPAPTVGSTTPSRVASPSVPVMQAFVPAADTRAVPPKHENHASRHPKHHSDGNDNKD